MNPPDPVLLARAAARRARLAQAMAAAGGGVALLPTAPEVMRNRDADFPYRHDSYFYYLSGFTEPDSWLLLAVDADGSSRSLLLCRPRDPEREIWDGLRWGPEAAAAAFGFDAAISVEQLDAELPGLLADRPALWWPMATHAGLESRIETWLTTLRAQARAGRRAPATQHDLCVLLDAMRLVKDDFEIELMQRAATISALAHQRAMQASARLSRRPPPQGLREYHLEAELLHAFRSAGAQSPAYGSIVAGGGNACVLHYRAADGRLQPGQLCLIDAACELDGYASDITRTFPIDGRFSAPQRALYDVVLAAQLAAIGATRAGVSFDAPHQAALRVLAQGLLDLGLLSRAHTPDVDAVLDSGAYRRFYMHRTSHWIGMDVHDCGDYAEPGAAPGADGRPQPRVLRPGMALTVEPGLYVRAAADIPAAFHDIGIRIEDEVVVRASDCLVLSADAPKHPDAIEALMQEAVA